MRIAIGVVLLVSAGCSSSLPSWAQQPYPLGFDAGSGVTACARDSDCGSGRYCEASLGACGGPADPATVIVGGSCIANQGYSVLPHSCPEEPSSCPDGCEVLPILALGCQKCVCPSCPDAGSVAVDGG